MTHNEHQNATPDFSDEAKASTRLFFDDLKKLGGDYEPKNLGELVVDGPLHPYRFLEANKNTRIWRDAKGVLLPIYKSYQEYRMTKQGSIEGWDPLDNSTYPTDINPVIFEMIQEYINFLRQPHTDTASVQTQVIEEEILHTDQHEKIDDLHGFQIAINTEIRNGRDPLEFIIRSSRYLSNQDRDALVKYAKVAHALATGQMQQIDQTTE